MADYYGLLARAVQALRRNDKSSRLEIYAKARHALIRQLKAITPPLPPEEISKQRLSLEEAIRRVEREAAEAAAAAMLSEEEIGRQAEQALEEALASDETVHAAYREPAYDQYAGDPYAAPMDEPEEVSYRPPPPRREAYRSEPVEEPVHYSPQRPPMDEPRYAPQPPREAVAERVQFEPPRRREPEVMPPRAAFSNEGAAARREEAYAEVVPPPVQPRTTNRSPAGPADWNRGGTVTDVEPPTPAQAKQQDRAARSKRGGRGWERQHRHVKRERMSMRARLTIVGLLLIVVAGAGYYVWTDWDNVSEYVTTLFGGEVEPVEVVVEEEIDPLTGEPVVFTEPTAVFYQEPGPDGLSPRYDATVSWSLVEDPAGPPAIAAHIEVPGRGISFDLQIGESTASGASHEVSIITTLAANAEPIQRIDNVSVKTSEEAIGIELEGTVSADATSYLLELPADGARLNTNRFATSPWFDIAMTLDSGERAVVAFSKGTVGARLFRQALDAWETE